MVIRLLINIPYFSDLTIEELENLVASSEMRSYPTGSVVLRKGDVGEMVYLIVKGRVKVVVTHPDGKEIILNVLKSGDFFGEMAIFGDMPRSATVVAEGACEFLVISREIIIDQIRKHPTIALKLLSDMSQRVREADEQICGLTHLDANGRVAQTLLKLSRESDMVTDEGYRVFPAPAVEDIAAMSGTSKEKVSRLLTELHNKGIIGLTEEYVLIYDRLDIEDDRVEKSGTV